MTKVIKYMILNGNLIKCQYVITIKTVNQIICKLNCESKSCLFNRNFKYQDNCEIV